MAVVLVHVPLGGGNDSDCDDGHFTGVSITPRWHGARRPKLVGA
jgi:hypothetical protein